MHFKPEPTHYIKGILADLQGGWSCLRNEVVNKADKFPHELVQRLIFHIDEGMSWESVRNLDKMKDAFLLIANIIQQNPVDEEITHWVEDIQKTLADVLNAIKRGEII